MSRIKLLHIISSLRLGGAEALLVDIIRELGNDRYEHHVIYFHAGPRVQQLHDLGVTTYRLNGKLLRYDPSMLWAAQQLIKTIKPQVIHAALWAGCWFGRLLGKWCKVPVICAVHLPIDSDGKVRNTIDGFTWNWADKVIAVSEGVAHSLRAGNWVPEKKIALVRNGINYQLMHEQAASYNRSRAQIGLAQEHLVFGCVGRFVSHKRQDLLLKAFAPVVKQVPHARLVLMGIGPDEQRLRSLIEELHLQSFVQIISGQPAIGYYPLFDLFVLPSILEGLSIALLESMCFGLPGIVTGNNGYHDVIGDGVHGFVVPPDDQAALTEALLAMADESRRKQMGSAAREHVQNNFSLLHMTQGYDELFKAHALRD
jgi:glycosyltransferase involved in cell wall biosynthesis